MQALTDGQTAFNADDYAQRLAGQKGLAHFNSELRERKPTHFKGVFTDLETARLCSSDVLADLLMPDSRALTSIDIYSDKYLVHLADILHKSARLAVDVIAEQIQRGATIRFRNLENYRTELSALANAVGHQFKCTTDINAYLTPGHNQGFPPHFDNTDVIVVQVLGTKQWRLYHDYSHRTELPLRDTPWDADKYQPRDDGQHLELQVGDVLYVPRGGMHAAACETTMSLHLTISLDTDPAVDQLSRLIHIWAQNNVNARHRLPEEPLKARNALLELTQDFHTWLQRQDDGTLSSSNSQKPPNRDHQLLRDRFKQTLESFK